MRSVLEWRQREGDVRCIDQRASVAVTDAGVQPVDRFSEMRGGTVHLDVRRVVNGRLVIDGTSDFSANHQMT
jgi:hypothetical protein